MANQIAYKKKWVEDTIARAEMFGIEGPNGMGYIFDKVPDTITWLWKFGHITQEQKNEWCDRVTNVYEANLSLHEERASLGDGWW